MTTDDPTIVEASWLDLRGRLAGLVDALAELGFVVLSASDRSAVPHGYVQCKRMPGGLYCEAASDVYLPPGERLGPAGAATMAGLGWEPPNDGGNWHVTVAGPDDAGIAARLLTETLTGAFGVRVPAELRCDPPEASTLLGVEGDWERMAGQPPEGFDGWIAEAANHDGAYFGRNTDGIHTLEVGDTVVRVHFDDMGPVLAVVVSARIDSDVDPASVPIDLDGLAGAAGDYVLGRAHDRDGGPEAWLTTVVVGDGPEDPADHADVVDHIRMAWARVAEAARWAAAILDAAAQR